MARRKLVLALVTCALLAASCAAPGPDPARPSADRAQSDQRKTTAVLAISAAIPAFSYGYLGTSGGGAQSFNELWIQGLVTSGKTSPAPEPRIAAELPSLDKGTAEVLADGKLRVTWKIRPEVKWADGADLTARDYAFGFEILKSRDHTLAGATLVVNIGPLVESLDVVDDKTFTMTWVRPFYQFNAIGLFALQPMPIHVLRGVWDAGDMDAFANHPYWRQDFFQVGPYRPVKFEPQVEIVLQAVPHYFLGKPKLDTIVLKQYTDENVVYAGVLAKAIDLTADNSLNEDQAVELKTMWERTGEGKVYIGYGTSRGIFPMFKPEYAAEPAMLDPRVRQALYTAIDKDAWAAAMLTGQSQNAAYSLLPPADALYEFTKDSLRGYRHSTEQALRMLEDLGWTRGSGGALVSRADGHRFRVDLWTTQGSERDTSILADMWGQLGIESSQFIIPNAQQDNRELRQSFPGVEVSARGYGDHILTRAECVTLPVPPRFAGANRGHYCNPAMDELLLTYRTSITRADQGRAIADVARLHASDLPMMQLYFNLSHPTVAKGLSALENDFAGGIQASGYYGSYFRNAHEWEWR
jgi:peptide/nickel transport system substrate-binding protein